MGRLFVTLLESTVQGDKGTDRERERWTEEGMDRERERFHIKGCRFSTQKCK